MSKEAIAIKALEALARLGNGDQYGNSTGNVIARTALFEMAEQPAHTATYTCGACGVSMRMEQPAPVQEPLATLFGSLPVYDTTPQAPKENQS